MVSFFHLEDKCLIVGKHDENEYIHKLSKYFGVWAMRNKLLFLSFEKKTGLFEKFLKHFMKNRKKNPLNEISGKFIMDQLENISL